MKHLLPALFLGFILLVVPFASEAAGLVPCGNVAGGEQPCQSCDVVKLTNNVISWLVMILSIIAALIIVYAGVKLVTAGGNTHAMEEAKSTMTNIIIGFVIVLAGWLVVDYGMKALVNDRTFGVWNEVQCTQQPVAEDKGQTVLNYSNPARDLTGVGNWSVGAQVGEMQSRCDVIAAGPGGTPTFNCAAQAAQCRNITGAYTINAARDTVTCTPSVAGSSDTSGLGICSPGNSACSISMLQRAGLSLKQASIMSCLAMTESTGNPSARNSSPGSSACGTWQVVRSTWRGAAVGSCSDFSNCTNASCNMSVAITLVRQSGYSSWTCPNCNAKAQACVDKYGG